MRHCLSVCTSFRPNALKVACVFPNLCLYELKVQGWAHLWIGHKNWHRWLRLNKLFLLSDNKQLFVIAGFIVIRAGQVGEKQCDKRQTYLRSDIRNLCAPDLGFSPNTVRVVLKSAPRRPSWRSHSRRSENDALLKVRNMFCDDRMFGFFMHERECVNCWTNLAVVIPTGALPRTLALVLWKKGGTALGFISPLMCEVYQMRRWEEKNIQKCVFKIQYMHTNLVSVCSYLSFMHH